MVKVELVQEKHFDNLITFLSNFENENKGEKFWTDRLNSWWKDNPSYNSNVERGWVLVNNSDLIVGFLGNIPSSFIIIKI